MLDGLKEHTHLMVALCLVGILGLLYNEMKKANKELTLRGLRPVKHALSDGFSTGGNIANRFQRLSGLGQTGSNVSDNPGVSENMEAPVFWNAGSYATVNSSQQNAAGGELYDNTNWGARAQDRTNKNVDVGTGNAGNVNWNSWNDQESMANDGYVERMAPSVLGQDLNNSLY